MMIGTLLEDKDSGEGGEYEYIPIENVEPIFHSTPKKHEVLAAVATLVGNIKKLPLEDLKHVLSTTAHEMEERRIPFRSPSKPPASSLAHGDDLSSVLHSLIKEGAL